MNKVLVTGGAGYIGSFMVKRLLDEGFEVVVLDIMERGHKEFIDQRATVEIGNILNKEFIASLFSRHTFSAVFHFAAYISVGESVQHPDEYFKNNTFGSLCLLEQMRMSNVKNLIFSSTAGVYGNPHQIPIPEDHPKQPESPYGESKLLVENSLLWYQQKFGINFVALRYFNAAGAAPDASMGEAHPDETHIIPCIINAAINNNPFNLYGVDYPTEDGTCVRDYIHVLDLVDAHLLAHKKIKEQPGGYFYNVGTGAGYSNKQVVKAVEEVSQKKIEVWVKNRRPGDPAKLVADNTKIKSELGFSPKYSELKTIVEHAWKWHTKEVKS